MTANFGFSSLAILVSSKPALLVIPSVASQISITGTRFGFTQYCRAQWLLVRGIAYGITSWKLNTVAASIAQPPQLSRHLAALLLSEPVTMQFVISSTVILLGISLVLSPLNLRNIVSSLTTMAKPNKKQPTKTVQIFCAKCKTQLFKHRKEKERS